VVNGEPATVVEVAAVVVVVAAVVVVVGGSVVGGSVVVGAGAVVVVRGGSVVRGGAVVSAPVVVDEVSSPQAATTRTSVRSKLKRFMCSGYGPRAVSIRVFRAASCRGDDRSGSL